ncbi:MAG: hypothetical protein ACLT2Z_09620 [Eubacterium sp.]
MSYSREALAPLSHDIRKFAKAEGLTAVPTLRVRLKMMTKC